MTNTTKTNYTLRYNEYYDMQETFDSLYAKSKEGKQFTKLYELIISENNIILAFRNIKSNTGSKTKGTDKKTISDIKNMTNSEVIDLVRNKLKDYKPDSVRRVLIPKSNGKLRPLGIPTISDRLVQQCFKQVLEPIAEAKFHKHSYGFRPNRSTEHAVHRMQHLINQAKLYYCVDIDIKGFFDEIHHGKLLKQLWSMGIRDKTVISIISKMLKAEIEDEGVSKKGIPQGGILSPLLANVVLNELDWWLSSQWETAKTRHVFANPVNKYRPLKLTKLKEFFFVRYADDFKILCRSKDVANNIYIATKSWLKTRLHLDISEEKSKITNLKKNASEFLGFSIKATKKNKKLEGNKGVKSYFSTESHMTEKAIKNSTELIINGIKSLQKNQSHANVGRYNSLIMGIQNYYGIASHITQDLAKVEYRIRRSLYNRLRRHLKIGNFKNLGEFFKKRYKDYNGIIQVMGEQALYPIYGIKSRNPMAFKQSKCNYTEEGRKEIYSNLDKFISNNIRYLLRYPIRDATAELNDNRISKYSAQKGLCAITGEILMVNNFDVHHIKMKSLGGEDTYSNLICINKPVHKLIHAKDENTIKQYIDNLKPNTKILEKINKYRTLVGNSIIEI